MGNKTISGDYINLLAGVGLPLAQAVVVTVFSFPLALTVCFLSKADHPWIYSVALALSAGLVTWFSRESTWLKKVYPQPEPKMDTYLAETKTEKIRYIIPHNSPEGRFMELENITEDQIVELCQGLAGGLHFDVATWVYVNKTFSRKKFEALRQVFILNGILRWRNPHHPQSGVEFTSAGRAFIRFYAGQGNGTQLMVNLIPPPLEDSVVSDE